MEKTVIAIIILAIIALVIYLLIVSGILPKPTEIYDCLKSCCFCPSIQLF